MESEADTAARVEDEPPDDATGDGASGGPTTTGAGGTERGPTSPRRRVGCREARQAAAASATLAHQRKEVVRIVVTVFAGPWRCPAADRKAGPRSGIHTGHPRAGAGLGPSGRIRPPRGCRSSQRCERRAPEVGAPFVVLDGRRRVGGRGEARVGVLVGPAIQCRRAAPRSLATRCSSSTYAAWAAAVAVALTTSLGDGARRAPSERRDLDGAAAISASAETNSWRRARRASAAETS